MNYLYNDPKLKQKRKLLRRTQTEAEQAIWRVLRNKQMNGLKFFRQYSVHNYILDFYCPAKRLAIEIDGSQHIENLYDIERTKKLNDWDIMVLRFWNNDVLKNLSGVYEKIRGAIEDINS